MARRRRVPEGFRVVRTYDELLSLAKCFAEGGCSFLIMVGPPGRLKSSIFKSTDKDAAGKSCWIEGHHSPFVCFCKTQVNKDADKLYADDAEDIYKNPDGPKLMKQLGDDRPNRSIDWGTIKPLQYGLEQSFTTSFKVCVIANEWRDMDEHLSAVADRARLIYFDPTPEEVHREVLRHQWYLDLHHDEEIYAFVGQHLQYITDPSSRIYRKAKEAKNRNDPNDPWKKVVLEATNLDDAARELILLHQSGQRVEAQADEFGQSRSSFFALKKKLGLSRRWTRRPRA